MADASTRAPLDPDEQGNRPHRVIPGPDCDLTALSPDEYVRADPPWGWLVYRDRENHDG